MSTEAKIEDQYLQCRGLDALNEHRHGLLKCGRLTYLITLTLQGLGLYRDPVHDNKAEV